jgi:type I restriction enzyme M protein
VEHDLIDGVILLPENLFYNTMASGIIIVIRKNKPRARRGQIVLVNASKEFRKGTPKNYLTDEGLGKISDAITKGTPEKGFCAVITNDDAAANDFNLSPSRYISVDDDEVTRPLQDVIRDLVAINAEQHTVDLELNSIFQKLGLR